MGTARFSHTGGVDIVSASEFSVACGGSCGGSTDSSTPAEPAPSPTPEPVLEAPEPIDSSTTAPEGSCAESSPIEISSTSYPEAEGCYFQTEVDVSDGFVEIIYTPSGEPEVGQLWMHPDAVVTETGTLPGVGTRSFLATVTVQLVAWPARTFGLLSAVFLAVCAFILTADAGPFWPGVDQRACCEE